MKKRKIMKNYRFFLRLIYRVGKNILNNSFNVQGMKAFFERIGSSEEAILKNIELQVNKDPNKTKILRNIELFKSRGLK